MLWVYLLSIASAFGLFAVYAWRSVEQRRAFESGMDTMFVEEPPPIVTIANPTPRRAPTLGEQLGLSGALALRTQAETPLFTLRGDGPPKECPVCQRQFASWMVVCPHDAATLRPPKQRTMRRAGPSSKELGRARCPKCERRYPMGTLFCTHDGESLVEDTTTDAAPVFVCRSCGRHAPELDSEPCCDDVDRITLDPRETTSRGPAIALLACPRCHTYGALGSIQCAHDGEFLVPASTLPAHTHAPTGYGPRRKLCPVCGTRFSGASSFCCDDGSRLKPLD